MHLARRGAQVTLIDPRPPLTATSQYSTECYRNFFLDESLVPLMTRSIDIMEELAGEENVFNMNRRGYAFLSATDAGVRSLESFAEIASRYGAGPVRTHEQTSDSYIRSPTQGFQHPDMHGFDLVYGSDAIREIFPFVSETAKVLLHARRCGWVDAQGLGQTMLQTARAGAEGGGAKSVLAKVTGFDKAGDCVKQVYAKSLDGQELAFPCDAFVNAAGAWTSHVNSLLAPDDALPLVNELHAKVVLNDKLNIIPQTAPFMVWRDGVSLPWDEEMREALTELDDTAEGGTVNSASWLMRQPGGQHLRPAGNGRVLLLWEHLHRHIRLPAEPAMPVEDVLDMYMELCIGGLKEMVPGLERYDGQLGRDTTTDGGYYTLVHDGRPLVGKHGADNAFVCGGMGTYGLMASPAAGELAALCALGLDLPSYAGACSWPRTLINDEKPIDLLDESG